MKVLLKSIKFACLEKNYAWISFWGILKQAYLLVLYSMKFWSSFICNSIQCLINRQTMTLETYVDLFFISSFIKHFFFALHTYLFYTNDTDDCAQMSWLFTTNEVVLKSPQPQIFAKFLDWEKEVTHHLFTSKMATMTRARLVQRQRPGHLPGISEPLLLGSSSAVFPRPIARTWTWVGMAKVWTVTPMIYLMIFLLLTMHSGGMKITLKFNNEKANSAIKMSERLEYTQNI